jgi:hypothetical protein
MVLDWDLGFLSVFLSCNYCRAFSCHYAEMLNGAEEWLKKPFVLMRSVLPYIAITRVKNKLKLHLAVACISDVLRVGGVEVCQSFLTSLLLL